MFKRLAARLFLSHTALAGLLLAAMGVTVYGLVEMTRLIGEISEEQFGQLLEEEALHNAAWLIEVEARHGILACEEQPEVEPRLRERLTAATVNLEQRLQDHGARVTDRMRLSGERYAAFARRVLEGEACQALQEQRARRERLLLDEELTEAWIGRMRELHTDIVSKEKRTQRIGSSTTALGLSLAVIAWLLALVVVRRLASGVTNPLRQLARQAGRVGEGDFSPFEPIEGPLEVQELSWELDAMRARLAELDHLKQSFIASVSHDLRTPLGRLREALGLLADGTVGPINEAQKRVLSLARKACEGEIRLVSALLDMSRMRAGRPLRLQAGCSIDLVIASVVDQVQPDAEAGQVQLVVEKAGEVQGASLDAALIERALANIVSNAVSVSAPGRTVRITREAPSAERGERGPGTSWVRIVVRDEGPGIAREVRSRLFEPFFTRAVGSRKDGVGLGLGLPLARDMIRAHGGNVEYLDEPGPGAAFAVWIPLERRSDSGLPPEPMSDDSIVAAG